LTDIVGIDGNVTSPYVAVNLKVGGQRRRRTSKTPHPRTVENLWLVVRAEVAPR